MQVKMGQRLHTTTLAVLLLLAVLSLAFTYPLPFHLADAVEDRQDALLNVWITAWDAHQLLADPLDLFNANIFYPYPRTLAYSELLLGNALLALPIIAVSGNPVLGYNSVLILSFVLSGLGTYLLVLKLTGRHTAGVVGGLIFAFSSYRMTNLAQAQILTTHWLPFALLALHHLLCRPRLRYAAAFVLFSWLQTVSSFYYGILLALVVAGFWIADLVRTISFKRRHQAAGMGRATRSTRYLLLAVGCWLLLILPFAVPYFRVQRDLGFERTLADSEPFSASLQQYTLVPPGSVLHGLWLPSDDKPRAGGYPVDALFPGFVALALGAWGLIRGQGRARWLYAGLLLAAFCLSLGPRLYLAPNRPAGLDLPLPYAWLYAVVPGFKAMRAPVRFDALVMLALAVLAGYGLAALPPPSTASPADSPSIRSLSAIDKVLLVSLVILESLVWPGAHAEQVPVGDQVPPVYRWLAEQPPRPVLELPMAFTAGGPQLDYQYLSTYHWQPTPDGYSGFIPPQHGQIVYEMDRFPSERSVSLLQALGVQQVVLHTDRYPASRWREMEMALAQSGDLALAETFGTDRVYAVEQREFSAPEERFYLPPLAAAGQPYTAYLITINNGPRSYALAPVNRVERIVRWERTDGQVAGNGDVRVDNLPLVTSPDGGAAVIPLPLEAPDQPGTYRLKLGTEGASPDSGPWQAEGTVEVGNQAGSAFPVPVRLAGWSIPSTLQPGQPLPVTLAWQALGKIDAYYSVYVKLIDAQGNTVAGWDGQPGNGQTPTLTWVPGEMVNDVVNLAIPAGTPRGEYTVEVGMYRAEDLARALLLGSGDAGAELLDRVTLGTIRVEP
jgi:hypothetical protein